MDAFDLYEQAVQHPEAEAAFLLRAYRTHRPEAPAPTRLREDFAGAAAVARAFVSLDENHRAVAVDHDPQACRRAVERRDRSLGDRATDLPVIEADVRHARSPRVDLVAALNFSALTFHDRGVLRGYLRRARRALRRGGLFMMDVFGGPGALRVGEQRRRGDGFTYHWEQRAVDLRRMRIDCRIHFTLDDQTTLRDAFVYDWRLWSAPELDELCREAGFADVALWCDNFDPAAGRSDGRYAPIDELPTGVDFIAYVVALK